jgi:hypothetical protein
MSIHDYYVYAHRRNDTGNRFYIGKGRLRRAWLVNGRGTHWARIVARHGYTVEILSSGLSEKEAVEKEKELIAAHGRANVGTGLLINKTDGGDGISGYRHTQKTKMEMSARRGGENNYWFGKRGQDHNCYGRKHTDETKKKIGLAQLGEKHHSAKRVQCIETGVTFAAVSEAVRWLQSTGSLKADDSALIRVCRGTKMSAYGYKWRYVDTHPVHAL